MNGIQHTYVIAEAGVNHNGDLGRALEMVAAAAAFGADAIKFQTFSADKLASRRAPKARYQEVTTGTGETQYQMLARLQLSREDHARLAECCRTNGIEFLSSPFDVDSLTLLVDELQVRRVKIGSGEVTNGPLLLQAARSGRPIILSTGMCTLGDVEAALAVLAFGYSQRGDPTSARALRSAYVGAEGGAAIVGHVTLLHCTTEYPTPPEDVNLRAMDTLRGAFRLPVGLSDHTQGTAAAIAAVAREASVIEKHFTLDRKLPGPDHRASLEPAEFEAMVGAIRAVERSLGDSRKVPSPSERDNETVARRSLVAARPIAKGEKLTSENLASKRPGGGISPLLYWDYLGRDSHRAYEVDEVIEP